MNILAVFFITVLIRLFLAYEVHLHSAYMLDGEFLSLYTPDAALYGYYAKLLIEGLAHEQDVHLIEYILYFFYLYTPFSLDQLLFFLPAFLSSLIVIPTMLLAQLYMKSKSAVIVSGLIAGIGYGYYSRSYLGYYDTDLLNLFFPMMIVYSMIVTVKKEDYRYILTAVVFNILYIFWYHSSLPLLYALNALFILYGLIFYFTKDTIYKASILLAVSLLPLAFPYKTGLILLLFLGFYSIQLHYKYYLSLFVAFFIVALCLLDFSQLWFHIQRYLFKSALLKEEDLHFVAPMQYVAEAKAKSLLYIAKRISGNGFIFLLSLFGYLLLLFRHKEMILTLPILLLGVISIKAGVRFHIYAVSIMALSYIYLFYFAVERIKYAQKYFLPLLLLFSLPAFYENYKSVVYWNSKIARPVFTAPEVKALKKLKSIAAANAYAVAWWDYGWPLWYYTDLKTMIDNGRHHADNFTLSLIFMSQSQKFANHAIHYFYDMFAQNNQDAIIQALHKEKNMDTLFRSIQNYKEDSKSVQKYMILPNKMSRILYTIYKYSNIDPQSGRAGKKHLYQYYKKIKESKNFIYFNKGVKIDKKHSLLIKGKKKIAIKRFANVFIHGDKKMTKEALFAKNGVNLVKFSNRYYIMDDYFYNSTAVQLLFFNHYDKRYFLPVYEGSDLSIYRVK